MPDCFPAAGDESEAEATTANTIPVPIPQVTPTPTPRKVYPTRSKTGNLPGPPNRLDNSWT